MSNIDPLKTPKFNPIKAPPSFGDRNPKVAKALEITGIVLGILAVVFAVTLVAGAFGFPGGIIVGGAVLLGVGTAILAGSMVSLVKRELDAKRELSHKKLLNKATQDRKDLQQVNPKLNFNVPDSQQLFEKVKQLFSRFDLSITPRTKSFLNQIRLDEENLPRGAPAPIEVMASDSESIHSSNYDDSESSEFFETPWPKPYVENPNTEPSLALSKRNLLEEILLDEHTSLGELIDEVVVNYGECVRLLDERNSSNETQESLILKSRHVPGIESRNHHLVSICSRIIDGLASAGGVLSIKVPDLSRKMQKVHVAVTTLLVLGAIAAIALTAVFLSGGALLPVLLVVTLAGGVVVAGGAYILKNFLSKTERNKKELIEDLKQSLDLNKLKAISDLQNQLLVSLQLVLDKEKKHTLKHSELKEKLILIKQTLLKDPEKQGALLAALRNRLKQLRADGSSEESAIIKFLSGEVVSTDKTIQEIVKSYQKIKENIDKATQDQDNLLRESEKMQNDQMDLYQEFINLLENSKAVMEAAQGMQNEIIQELKRL